MDQPTHDDPEYHPNSPDCGMMEVVNLDKNYSDCKEEIHHIAVSCQHIVSDDFASYFHDFHNSHALNGFLPLIHDLPRRLKDERAFWKVVRFSQFQFALSSLVEPNTVMDLSARPDVNVVRESVEEIVVVVDVEEVESVHVFDDSECKNQFQKMVPVDEVEMIDVERMLYR